MFSSTLDGCVVSVSVRHMHNNQRWSPGIHEFIQYIQMTTTRTTTTEAKTNTATHWFCGREQPEPGVRLHCLAVPICKASMRMPSSSGTQSVRNPATLNSNNNKNTQKCWGTLKDNKSLCFASLSLCVCVVEFDINKIEWRPRARREQHTNTKNTHPHWALLFSHSILFNQIKYTIELLVWYGHSEYRPRSTKPSDRKVVCYQKHIIRMVLQQYKKTISSS